MKLKMAFVMDPVGTINTEKDTTYVLMLEAQERGHDVYYLELKDMFVKNARAFGNASRINLKRGRDFYKLGEREPVAMETFDTVWMRKDPPFNQNYIYATYLLSLINQNKTKVINDPRGIRESNEKLYTLYFPEWIPASIVTKDMDQLNKFLAEQGGEIVVKPLDGHGGEGVFYVREGDRNSNVILETITNFGKQYILAQRFIKEVSEGDKRIILLNGEPLGAVLRVPKPGGEFRCNFHSGGSPAKSALTERDIKICKALSRRLKKDGLYFVGIDVIGGYITEINTTSPTGIQEINRLNGVKLEAEVIDFAEKLCAH